MEMTGKKIGTKENKDNQIKMHPRAKSVEKT